MRRMLLAVFVAATGCVTTTTPTPPRGPYPVTLKLELRVLAGESLVGHLKLQEIGGVRFYRVETPSGGFVGTIDENLHFARCEPFRAELRQLGIYPMKKGLALLFEASDPIRILPLEHEAVATEAAAVELMRKVFAVPATTDRDR